MFRAPRYVAFVALASLALFAAGCGKSSNEGKIVGKWKITEMPGMGAEETKMMEMFQIQPYMEFRQDGTMSIGATSSNPEIQKKLEQSDEKTVITCKYKLQSGDTVEFYDLPKELQEKGGGMFGKNKDRAQVTIKIDGDNMTMTDAEKKTGKLVRMK